jgi:hypothetical protein
VNEHRSGQYSEWPLLRVVPDSPESGDNENIHSLRAKRQPKTSPRGDLPGPVEPNREGFSRDLRIDANYAQVAGWIGVGQS